MANIIMLQEPLTFGKYRGLTGAELMKCAEGTKYLKWIWEQTDIQMQDVIVHSLHAHGIIDRKLQRANSRAGGGVASTSLKDSPQFGMLIQQAGRVAARNAHQQPEDNLKVIWTTNPVPRTHPILEKLNQIDPEERRRLIEGDWNVERPDAYLSKGEIVRRFRNLIDKSVGRVSDYM